MSASLTRTPSQRAAIAWAHSPVVAFLKHKEQITFFRQLQAMIHSGMALPVAFADLAKYAPSEAHRRSLLLINAEVEKGSTLTDALRRHPTLFEDAHLELIAFAEQAGKLDPVLLALIDHLDQVHKLRWKAIMSSIYPLYFMAAFVLVGPLLDVAQSLKCGGGILGPYLAGVARNVTGAGVVVATLLLFPVAMAYFGQDVAWDRFKRSVPTIGPAIRDLSASRFVLMLGLAIGSGLEALRALKLSAHSVGSPAVDAAAMRAEQRLRSGSTLVDAVAELGLLERTSLGSLAVAEKTGTLEKGLKALSTELQETSLRAIRLIILALCAVVGGVVVIFIVKSMLGVIFGPISKLYNAAGTGEMEGLGK